MNDFSYKLTTTVGKMRLELGDHRLNDGMLPKRENFTDAELTYFFDEEDEDFNMAIARAFDAAAVQWASYPDSMHMGPEFQKIPAHKYYAQRAEKIRTGEVRPGVYAVEKDEIAMDVD